MKNLMKPIESLLTLILTGAIVGCGSVVKSTKETALPKTSEPLTAIRYYLPRGKIQVSAAWNLLIPGWEPKITPIIEADPTACYRVERNINALFDDNIALQVDPMTGLLQCASATSTDQSVSAIGNLAAGAESAMTFGANLGSAGGGASRGELTAEELDAEQKDYRFVTNQAFSSSFSLIVDSHNPKQVYYLVEPDSGAKTGPTNAEASKISQPQTHKLYAKYDIELERITPAPLPSNDTGNNSGTLDGIVVRTPIPHRVKVSATFYKEGRHPIAQVQQSTTNIVFLPDDEHDYYLPLTRIPLVTTSTKVVLVNGMVLSLERSRPSLVNAIAGVPKNILSALVPLPFSIHQSNVQVGSANQGNGGTSGTGSNNP
jgi:hypothetical protein